MYPNNKHTYKPYKSRESGIALLIAVIFMSVVLSIGLSLASFGYKNVMLSSAIGDSQKAFYAADSALECVLYVDQQDAAFLDTSFHSHSTSFTCNNSSYTISNPISKNINGTTWQVYTLPQVSFGDTCATVDVYKETAGSSVGKTYLFSTGYNNKDCTLSNKTAVRGIETRY